jgi:hypothetical protein
MRKIALTLLLLVAAASAEARCCYYRGGWVGPALLGGVIGYELSRPSVIVQQPIVVQQPVVTQLPPAPYGYHYQLMVNPQNNFQQWVLVPN